MNDVQKLPKWARDKIRLLEDELRIAQREISMLTAATETDISLHFPGGNIPGETKQFLSEHQSVYFRFGNTHVQVRRHKRDGVYITSSANALHVQPHSCNSISVVPMHDTVEVTP